VFHKNFDFLEFVETMYFRFQYQFDYQNRQHYYRKGKKIMYMLLLVNLEFDIIGKYVAKLMLQNQG
jgi:hypothetical protein